MRQKVHLQVKVENMRGIFLLIFVLLTVGVVEPGYDAVIVRSDMPFDWIIAQAYSQKYGIPIITTSPEQLDSNVRSQLSGYTKFVRVLIIGGELAISPSVKAELDSMGFITHRISEGDRYGTSARAAIELYERSDAVVLVNGNEYVGLLVAERTSLNTGAPILFIRYNEIPASVMQAMQELGVKEVFLVDARISEKIQTDLSAGGYSIKLINGADAGRPVQVRSYFYFFFGVLLGVLLVLLALRFKEYRERVPYTILTEDEEKVVKAVLEKGGEMLQEGLPEKTDFSRPKVSRLVAGLVERGIISKETHGRTQKLIIKKEFYETEKD